MDVGALNERVSLQRLTTAPDGYGGSSETWTEYAEVWAKVQPMKGQERQASDRQEATSDYLVTIRYRDDVRDSDKIVWRGRDMNIRFRRDPGPRTVFLQVEAALGEAS